MRDKKILLVDDEESIRNSFCKDFEGEGYTVTTAASGEEAIANLQKDHFDPGLRQSDWQAFHRSPASESIRSILQS